MRTPRGAARAFAPSWPPDDTEESVVGTNLHQLGITNLRAGINVVAARQRAPDEPLPWKAVAQVGLDGCVHPDGTPYYTLPDVFVFLRDVPDDLATYPMAEFGTPVLVIEVASASTVAVDLDLACGKGYSYARAGVREYLVLDPTGTMLPDLGRAWRLQGGVYLPWQPVHGRWESARLPLSLGVEGVMPAVYNRAGARQPWEQDMPDALARIAEQEREIAALRRRLAEREAPPDRGS